MSLTVPQKLAAARLGVQDAMQTPCAECGGPWRMHYGRVPWADYVEPKCYCKRGCRCKGWVDPAVSLGDPE